MQIFLCRAAIASVMLCAAYAADLAADIRDAATRVDGHPRLFMTQERAAQLPDLAKADPLNAKTAEALLARAEKMLEEPAVTREVIGRRMLHISRKALDRITTLSMAWQLSGDARFVDRAVAELQAIAAFQDWNPSHFLDTAEMTLAAAIGYDWLHSELDANTREMVGTAIFEKGLTPALASDRHWWMHTDNNWNQVCHGGLVAGALVLLEDKPDAAQRMIERAVRHVPTAMATYAPLGAYPEGPSYWNYGTSYNVVLLAILESALGGTFGLDEATGFDRTGEFPILMTGPSGQQFNFSDGRPNRSAQPVIYWLANKYDRAEWAVTEDQLLNDSPSASWLAGLSLLWRDPDAAPSKQKLPLHWTSRNDVPVSVHRESWENPNATFFGLKAGSPSASHGQMDIGSFVLDANGVRWAHDLGMENYHQVESQNIALWHKHQDAGRWRVFRNNNFSHSTLVIDGQLQHASGNAPMAKFSDNPAFPHSVVDMSPAYQTQVDKAHRGIAMLPGGSVLVRDHLTGLKPGAEVRWAMVTRAETQNSNTLVLKLRENGEELDLSIHGDPSLRWQIIDLAESPQPWDSPNPGVTMVAFTAIAPESGNLDLTVVLRPGDRPAAELTHVHLAPPMEWPEAAW